VIGSTRLYTGESGIGGAWGVTAGRGSCLSWKIQFDHNGDASTVITFSQGRTIRSTGRQGEMKKKENLAKGGRVVRFQPITR